MVTNLQVSPKHPAVVWLYHSIDVTIGWPGDRPRTFATEKHIRLESTTIRTNLKAIVFASKPHQDVGPRSNEGAGESDRVGHVR